jgi:hypothetical protein
MQKIANKLKLFLDKKNVICVFAISAFAFNVIVFCYYNLFFATSISYNSDPISDYFSCFSRAVHYFLIDPSSIYSADYSIWITQIPLGNYSVWNWQIPFRNLPAFILYYAIFYLFPAQNHIDFFVCTSCIIIWNLGSCILVIKILKLQKFKENQGSSIFSSSAIILSFFLLNFWQQFEYYQGDANIITGFFVLLGMYFFLSDREHLGYVSWSIAVTFKITIVFLIIFFIFQSPLKRFLKNVAYVLIPQFPNIMIFAFWPNLIFDFLKYNIFTATNVLALDFIYSGSIARELSWAFSIPLVPLVIPIFIICLGSNLFLCYTKSQHLTFINRLMVALDRKSTRLNSSHNV